MACVVVGIVIGAGGAVIIMRKCKPRSDRSNDSDSSPDRGTPENEDVDQGLRVHDQSQRRVPLFTCGTTNNDGMQQMVRVMEQMVRVMKQTVRVLNKLQTELEKQTGDVRQKVENVEKDKKTNKKELESVEAELKEREANFDKPEYLVRRKEELLHTEWKWDEIKRIYDQQQINIDKMMELLVCENVTESLERSATDAGRYTAVTYETET
ncbi:uncharacterized protein LOC103375281 [Stegastes partitus]|uniref:Uncharacterized protein LOC103375281 n=1 Tax=Stegastes partitus TaxID=144197 RepID=A0A9Y4NUE7_9TELE|nr:PREDICTED: uncharacterized protein LOC103375281 [Stegastes partitus]